MGTAGRVQAWLAGPGMGTDEQARRRLAAVLATDLPVLVDADGLTLLAESPALVTGRRAATLLTPHAGELARLLRTDPAEVTARRAEHARAAARAYGCCVLLKGSTTVIAAGRRPAARQPDRHGLAGHRRHRRRARRAGGRAARPGA